MAADAEQLALAGGVQRHRVGDERERDVRVVHDSSPPPTETRIRPARHSPTRVSGISTTNGSHARTPLGAHPHLEGEQRRDGQAAQPQPPGEP